MTELRASNGRFASTVEFRKLRVSHLESRYELLVFDRHWSLVVPLNGWYRLRKNRGAPRTRDTYLAMLCPFVGFLLDLLTDKEVALTRNKNRYWLWRSVDQGMGRCRTSWSKVAAVNMPPSVSCVEYSTRRMPPSREV